ncbi:MAG: 5-oxoprolinase subunit PxpB [Bacillus sp. (in: firmicutes)]
MRIIEFKPLGDAALVINFGEKINETIYWNIQQFVVGLNNKKVKGIIEWVPAYTSIAIYYRPEEISYRSLVEEATVIYAASSKSKPYQPIVYEIPVFYGGETGPDLSYIAGYHNMSEREVIELHSNIEYLIYMLGFIPGFPYLGGLPSKLTVPRLEHPRRSVPPGSVGIGGNQTGIYPSEVPSGWRILGITPIKLFDIENSPPSLFAAGNYIKFIPVDLEEYQAIKQLIESKEYRIKTYIRGGET